LNTTIQNLQRHIPLLAVVALLFTLTALPARADLVLVVSSRSSIERLSREDAINIFMGRYRKAPDDSAIRPFDLEGDSPVRKVFYRRLIDKRLEEVNAYWARLVFAGRTVPPTQAKGQDDMLEKLASDPHAIGYVDRNFLNASERASLARNLKVVFSLPD
jgi:ABC-type phosphate transport system substrate-binding protein